jgi:hypothetical protein
MAKTPGCWASVLDDCHGPLTGEHAAAVALWQPDNPKANRRSKKREIVHVGGGGAGFPAGPQEVKKLKRPILCEHHNNGTSALDEEAGRFSTALGSFLATVLDRAASPRVAWPPRVFEVDGVLVERYLLKFAVNNIFGSTTLPIGGLYPAPGYPTQELAAMIFGHLPMFAPTGLWSCAKPSTQFTLVDGKPAVQFRAIPITYSSSHGRYISGCMLELRCFPFAVVLDHQELPNNFADAVPGWEGVQPRYRPPQILNERTNVAVVFKYPWS